MRVSGFVFVVAAAIVAAVTPSLAQKVQLYGADVTVKLSDPVEQAVTPWTVKEPYSVTWHSMKGCESQKQNIVNDYVTQIGAIDLTTPSGNPPLVEVEVECIER